MNSEAHRSEAKQHWRKAAGGSFREVLIYSEWQHKYANFSCSKEKNRRNRIQSAASQRTALRYFKIF